MNWIKAGVSILIPLLLLIFAMSTAMFEARIFGAFVGGMVVLISGSLVIVWVRMTLKVAEYKAFSVNTGVALLVVVCNAAIWFCACGVIWWLLAVFPS